MASSVRAALRPVRDLLYDTLRSEVVPDEGLETSSEVKKSLDEERGFIYFTNFDDLLHWTPEACLDVQKSNVPLLERPDLPLNTGDKTANITIIHDHGSGYHEYEGQQPVELNEPPYTCSNLQFLDTFVYFTHHLVSIPPPSWINLLHRNSVKCLGTFLIEPQTPSISRIFTRDKLTGTFTFARLLSLLAHTIGFDGYLINIESPFPSTTWSLPLLLSFLRQLRADIPNSTIIFYDALTASNTKAPQNALTDQNLAFLQATGNILLNYRWDPALVASSLALAQDHGIDPQTLIFGIDVWAQNRPRSFWHPRITWPPTSGGGTNTGVAVAKLAEMGVSAGIFAPAWSWQHFGNPRDRGAAERAVWFGEELPVGEVGCACQPGWFEPRDPHRTREYMENPVVSAASQFPAGGKRWFKTTFHQGFTKIEGERYISALGEQSILPVPAGRKTWELDPCRNSLALEMRRDVSEEYTMLYNLGIEAEDDMLLTVRYRFLSLQKCSAAYIVLTFVGDGSERTSRAYHLQALHDEEAEFESKVASDGGESLRRVVELGVRLKMNQNEVASDNTPILELLEIKIGKCPKIM